MKSFKPYTAKHFDLHELNGISDKTLDMHVTLYEGYVKATNTLHQQIQEFLKDGKVDQEEMPAYSELTRRLGFEYNGMVLHEYYFENLARAGMAVPGGQSAFRHAVEDGFGSYDLWKTDFASVGKMRGVGWAICSVDPRTRRISNHWVTLHETGNVAGFVPILVMDAWEHAYILDYAPSEREAYIEAFFSNVNWRAVDERLQAPSRTYATAG